MAKKKKRKKEIRADELEKVQVCWVKLVGLGGVGWGDPWLPWSPRPHRPATQVPLSLELLPEGLRWQSQATFPVPFYLLPAAPGVFSRVCFTGVGRGTFYYNPAMGTTCLPLHPASCFSSKGE